MPHFLELPREIRDMIYLAYVTWQRPTPPLRDSRTKTGWNFSEAAACNDRDGCVLPPQSAPRTCANFLACNRQVHEEMMQTMERARRKDMLAARLDCVAHENGLHYFTWLSIPVVKTHPPASAQKSAFLSLWTGYFTGRPSSSNGTAHTGNTSAATTQMEQLRIDIRLRDVCSLRLPERSAWAVCSVLKRILENGVNNVTTLEDHEGANTSIDEVTLNVVRSEHMRKQQRLSQELGGGGGGGDDDDDDSGTDLAMRVARQLVDVWNSIWAGDRSKGRHYQSLLAGIKQVRVCVDGATFRVRDLRLELERGQAERQRITARVGY